MPQGDPLYQRLLKWEERMRVCARVHRCEQGGHGEEADDWDSVPAVVYLGGISIRSLFPNENRVVLHLPKGLSPSGSYGLLSGLPGAAWLS